MPTHPQPASAPEVPPTSDFDVVANALNDFERINGHALTSFQRSVLKQNRDALRSVRGIWAETAMGKLTAQNAALVRALEAARDWVHKDSKADKLITEALALAKGTK